jgi:WD40 repeat protein
MLLVVDLARRAAERMAVAATTSSAVLRSVAWSPAPTEDPRWLASTADDGMVRLWDLRTRSTSAEFALGSGGGRSLAWSPDGGVLFAGTANGAVRSWHLADRRPGPELHGHTGSVTSLDCSPDSSTVLTAGEDGTLRFWALDSGVERLHARDMYAPVADCAVSPKGTLLAVTDGAGEISVFGFSSGTIAVTLAGHGLAVTDLAWTSDGSRIV